MSQLTPYLSFAGNCREALTFYQECLGGELSLQTVEGSPVEDQCPPEMKHQVLHGFLQKEGLLLMGSDMEGPGGYVPGNTVSLCVACRSEAEINAYFASLAAGGTILDPLGVKFWGDTFGVLTDKFGVRWMLNYDKNQPNP
jgi:PhnB protein